MIEPVKKMRPKVQEEVMEELADVMLLAEKGRIRGFVLAAVMDDQSTYSTHANAPRIELLGLLEIAKDRLHRDANVRRMDAHDLLPEREPDEDQD